MARKVLGLIQKLSGKSRNPIAKTLRSPMLRAKVIRSKKLYSRKVKHK